MQEKLQQASSVLEEKNRQLIETRELHNTLAETLARRSHNDTEYEGLQAALMANEEKAVSLEVALATAEASRAEMETLEFGARQELDIGRENEQRLKTELGELQLTLVEVEKRATAASYGHESVMR